MKKHTNNLFFFYYSFPTMCCRLLKQYVFAEQTEELLRSALEPPSTLHTPTPMRSTGTRSSVNGSYHQER